MCMLSTRNDRSWLGFCVVRIRRTPEKTCRSNFRWFGFIWQTPNFEVTMSKKKIKVIYKWVLVQGQSVIPSRGYSSFLSNLQPLTKGGILFPSMYVSFRTMGHCTYGPWQKTPFQFSVWTLLLERLRGRLGFCSVRLKATNSYVSLHNRNHFGTAFCAAGGVAEQDGKDTSVQQLHPGVHRF